ncbi:hypothetical protein HPB47_001438 [Ixodes persulcatus]|uniref:Uncharacterized protein n=1 Tax=Ixodes persulcatus TaxID=34615 RepID=A0AC60PP58_IXOPE|nr:hypothetical protein HPB47_001438 [Ixodes persulcatus]
MATVSSAWTTKRQRRPHGTSRLRFPLQPVQNRPWSLYQKECPLHSCSPKRTPQYLALRKRRAAILSSRATSKCILKDVETGQAPEPKDRSQASLSDDHSEMNDESESLERPGDALARSEFKWHKNRAVKERFNPNLRIPTKE